MSRAPEYNNQIFACPVEPTTSDNDAAQGSYLHAILSYASDELSFQALPVHTPPPFDVSHYARVDPENPAIITFTSPPEVDLIDDNDMYLLHRSTSFDWNNVSMARREVVIHEPLELLVRRPALFGGELVFRTTTTALLIAGMGALAIPQYLRFNS